MRGAVLGSAGGSVLRGESAIESINCAEVTGSYARVGRSSSSSSRLGVGASLREGGLPEELMDRLYTKPRVVGRHSVIGSFAGSGLLRNASQSRWLLS